MGSDHIEVNIQEAEN